MAKKKIHTNANQSAKQHRNGIHKVQRHRYVSLKGVNPKFLRNQRFCVKHNSLSPANQKLARLAEKQKAFDAAHPEIAKAKKEAQAKKDAAAAKKAAAVKKVEEKPKAAAVAAKPDAKAGAKPGKDGKPAAAKGGDAKPAAAKPAKEAKPAAEKK